MAKAAAFFVLCKRYCLIIPVIARRYDEAISRNECFAPVLQVLVAGFVEQVEQNVNPLASLRGGNDEATSRNECFAPVLQL